MIRYVLWAVLFGVDIFEFLRIWFGYLYIYIYIYIYERICITHSLSCIHTHTHMEGRMGEGAKGQRDCEVQGRRD